MYWDWDQSYGIDSDVTLSRPGDWTACTCTSKQKIYYTNGLTQFYEKFTKKSAKTCGDIGLRHCTYRRLENIDSGKQVGLIVKTCPYRRRLRDEGKLSVSGLVIGETVAYEDLPAYTQDQVVFVAEEDGIQEPGED